ncbi:hypothetical protein OE88DRAFT_1642249 [Heliocybe sulcata]|uniref:Uncharacterized protein n=1 Tax=Heliocybe sulcata TaxID=5364 RepID=A0A5C3NAW6_9AGAM|nr:hypothetical protein OE88DRAFT_1642249 [Heliocybe sulcata]
MPAIVCPQPRSATSSPGSCFADLTPASSPGPHNPTMPSSFTFGKRRRSPNERIYQHSPLRQRHCSKGDFHIKSLGVFDRMPLPESQEESSVGTGDLDMTDVLDWSDLGYGYPEYLEPSSAGPIRTRRRSGYTVPDNARRGDRSAHPRALLPRPELSFLSPRTPSRRPVILSEVRFRSLLPVLP